MHETWTVRVRSGTVVHSMQVQAKSLLEAVRQVDKNLKPGWEIISAAKGK